MRQLIKVGALSQSYSWALSVSIRGSLVKQVVTRGRQLTKVVLRASSDTWALSHIPVRGKKAQFQGFLSQIVEALHRISRTPLLSCYHSVSCDVGTSGNIIRPGSGLLS